MEQIEDTAHTIIDRLPPTDHYLAWLSILGVAVLAAIIVGKRGLALPAAVIWVAVVAGSVYVGNGAVNEFVDVPDVPTAAPASESVRGRELGGDSLPRRTVVIRPTQVPATPIPPPRRGRTPVGTQDPIVPEQPSPTSSPVVTPASTVVRCPDGRYYELAGTWTVYETAELCDQASFSDQPPTVDNAELSAAYYERLREIERIYAACVVDAQQAAAASGYGNPELAAVGCDTERREAKLALGGSPAP